MRGIRLFNLLGIDIHMDWSLLIIFALIVVSLGNGLFPAWHPDWPASTAWLIAVVAAVLFFASVLLHELAHALVARRNGLQVRRITLFVFGGAAQIEREPGAWAIELRMAVVGPLTSLAIGALCLLAVSASGAPALHTSEANLPDLLAHLGPGQTLLAWLGQTNLVLAIFNLVPAFPLDGGRVLRAVLWHFTGDLHRATRWASGIGQAFAWLLIAAGIAMILGLQVPLFGGGLGSGIWLAFIGWFLNNAALVSYRQLITREALEGVPVSRVMLTHFDTVDPDMPVDTLIADHALHSEQRAFPVFRDAKPVGMVFLQDLRGLDAAERRELHVSDVMKQIEGVSALKPQDDAFEALNLLGSLNVGQAPVMEDGRITGIVRREDILRWLAFHTLPLRG